MLKQEITLRGMLAFIEYIEDETQFTLRRHDMSNIILCIYNEVIHNDQAHTAPSQHGTYFSDRQSLTE